MNHRFLTDDQHKKLLAVGSEQLGAMCTAKDVKCPVTNILKGSCPFQGFPCSYANSLVWKLYLQEEEDGADMTIKKREDLYEVVRDPDELADLCNYTDKCPADLFFDGRCPQRKRGSCDDIDSEKWSGFLRRVKNSTK